MGRDSTGVRVELTFGFLVVLLIGVGWFGLSRMGQVNANLNAILDQGYVKLHLADQAVFYVNSNYRMLTALLLQNDPQPKDVEAYVAARQVNRDKILSAQKKISELAVSDEEKVLLGKIDEAGAAAGISVSRMNDLLLMPGRRDEGRMLFRNEGIPLMNRYGDAWATLISWEDAQTTVARVQSETNYARARDLSIAVVLIAIGVSIAVAGVAMRRMLSDARDREQSRDAIRKLNENLEKTVAERTEELNRTVIALRAEASARQEREAKLRRLAAIVESSDDAIVAITMDGTVTDWNPGAARMFGYTQQEMIGQPVSRMVPADRLGEPSRSLDRLINGEHVVRYETVRVRKDGSEVHVALTISPLRNSYGNLIGDTALFRDITERRAMEDALRRSEAGYRSLVQNAPIGILRTRVDGLILQANPAIVRMLGYASEQELVGRDMARDVYRRPEQRAEKLSWRKHQNSIRGVELEWKRKDGSPFTALCDSQLVRDADGYVEFLETFVEDVTERREMELQLRQRQKMEAVGRLAGGIAHDFNNLLGVIAGYSELASESLEPSTPLRNQIEQILKAADRASALTKQLLAFSRQQVLETRTLNLSHIVEDMSRMLPRLLGEDIDLRLSVDPDLCSVRADQGQIEQAILNLAVNSRDAMPAGGRLEIQTRNVRLDSELALKHPAMTRGEYVLLSVADTGAGMDAQTQAHIFEPFFTTKERGRGTGLGLAMVYGFVKQSGGYIWLESAPGAGATFEIYLPVARQEQVAADADAPAPSARAPESRGETILLVEDEESLRTLTRDILEQGGYRVIEAKNGDEALQVAAEHEGAIHLLLTDIVMPGMNGPAVAEKISALHPGIRVAFMTGYMGFGQSESGGPNGVVIAKPFSRSGLLKKLREALELDGKPA